MKGGNDPLELFAVDEPAIITDIELESSDETICPYLSTKARYIWGI